MKDVRLAVKELFIYKREDKSPLVRGIDIELKRGESLGIAGESGSGKTITLKSLMGLLPGTLYESYAEKGCSARMAMIFQNPMRALDPLCPVVEQLMEIYTLHHSSPGMCGDTLHLRFLTKALRGKELKAEAMRWTENMLRRLGLPTELMVRDRLPRELSGGQCQRICIALALACEPEVLLCDEPTTALDVTVQKRMLELLKELREEQDFSMIFVTHDLRIAANICDRIMVMKDGMVVEEGTPAELFTAPRTEYARKLVGAVLPVQAARNQVARGIMS